MGHRNFEHRNFMDRSFLAKCQAIFICSILCPSSASSDYMDAFEEDLSIAQTTGLQFILMGDFNIDITHSMHND